MLSVLDFVNEQNLLEDGDGVLLGVSGGADSVCLLFQFMKIMEYIDIRLHVIYVDHGIRGEESFEDGRFVKALCNQLYMPYTLISVDVPTYCKHMGLSTEEGARKLRYEAFFEEARRLGLNKIATAHNANDNAETILFQMIRGTGVKGLTGMDPISMREGYTLIRPLLETSREEIETYLNEIGQSYRTDSTNLTDDYARNKIRHQILPLMEEINKKAVDHINQAGRAVGKIFRDVEEDALDALQTISGEEGLDLWRLRQIEEGKRSEILLAWLKMQGAAHNVTKAHIEMLNELIFMEVGREYHLPHGFVVRNGYTHLRLLKRESETKREPEESRITVPLFSQEESYSLSLKGLDVRFRTRIAGENEQLPTKTYAKVFDYGKINGSMEIRHRKEGDYLVIHPDGRKKLLQDYFVEEKVPKEERDSVWMLCQGSKVIWIFGMRNSEDYRIDEYTKNILEVEYWRN